jgi:hypothetical protein
MNKEEEERSHYYVRLITSTNYTNFLSFWANEIIERKILRIFFRQLLLR